MSGAPSQLLSRGRRAALYTIGGGVWLSGVLWLWLHYFVVHQGPFGPTTSPLQAWSLTLHGAFAFAAIWVVGLLSASHIPEGWVGGRRRLSGAAMVAVLGWLILSGYLLYYLGDDRWRAVMSLGHWIFGLALPLGFLAHRLKRQRDALRRRALRTAPYSAATRAASASDCSSRRARR